MTPFRDSLKVLPSQASDSNAGKREGRPAEGCSNHRSIHSRFRTFPRLMKAKAMPRETSPGAKHANSEAAGLASKKLSSRNAKQSYTRLPPKSRPDEREDPKRQLLILSGSGSI
jgi:hypothetical protein